MDRNRSASEAFIPTTYAQKHKDDVKVSISDLPSARPDYKADKTCVLCALAFGKVLNIVHAKRYCCNFCYHGVCAKCSPYTLQHPETRQKERCCNACYNRLVTQDIRSTMQEELNVQRQQVRGLRGKVDEERQAELRETVEIQALQEKLHELETEQAAQKVRNQEVIQQLLSEESCLKDQLQALKVAKSEKAEKVQQAREQIARNEEEVAVLRKQQEFDQKKIAELLGRKAVVDDDLSAVRKQLQDPVAPQPDESLEKNKRVVELQQGLALERELLVKLQQENLVLTQRLAKTNSSDKPQQGREQELKEVPGGTMTVEELQARVATLRGENQRLEAELTEMKSVTPGEDSEMDQLKTAVAKEKEENTKLMLMFQERLLGQSNESLTRDKCHCCAF